MSDEETSDTYDGELEPIEEDASFYNEAYEYGDKLRSISRETRLKENETAERNATISELMRGFWIALIAGSALCMFFLLVCGTICCVTKLKTKIPEPV